VSVQKVSIARLAKQAALYGQTRIKLKGMKANSKQDILKFSDKTTQHYKRILHHSAL